MRRILCLRKAQVICVAADDDFSLTLTSDNGEKMRYDMSPVIKDLLMRVYLDEYGMDRISTAERAGTTESISVLIPLYRQRSDAGYRLSPVILVSVELRSSLLSALSVCSVPSSPSASVSVTLEVTLQHGAIWSKRKINEDNGCLPRMMNYELPYCG